MKAVERERRKEREKEKERSTQSYFIEREKRKITGTT
jgi:hypothetical protein